MTSSYNYTFDNLSRIGDDICQFLKLIKYQNFGFLFKRKILLFSEMYVCIKPVNNLYPHNLMFITI